MKDAEKVLEEMSDDMETLVEEDAAMRQRADRLYAMADEQKDAERYEQRLRADPLYNAGQIKSGDAHGYDNAEWVERGANAGPGEVTRIPDGVSVRTAAEIIARARRAKEAEANDEGKKYDGGKLPLHLLPVDALEAITEILDFGARKYAPRNWEKGMDWGRLYRAALGHLFDWWMGRGPDRETGKSHLWHAGCCILFLIAYEMRGVGKDDRPGNSA